jgi:16S rRNA (guanine966-N2)-methyltransferase
MTRIIAGFAGSLSLAVPKYGTRPTSDRVREAIFSALEARDAIDGAYVLDLYAGSGALGLEAASRGAASVTLVEKAYGTTELVRKNAQAVLRAAPDRGSVKITVTGQPVQAFLGGTKIQYDVVFLDPPYDLGDVELGHNLTALGSLVTENAIVVVERSARSPEPSWGPGLQLTRRKDYGDTTVWYAEPSTR